MKSNIITITLLSVLTMMVPVFSSHAQTAGENQAPAVSEEARKHFVMGETLFKDAKTPDELSMVESEFKQATDLAPQWAEARLNLALTRAAAGDFSGAMADLKLYQQFKLSDTEARAVQDKLYALEAKQKKAEMAAAKEAETKVGNAAKVKEETAPKDLSGIWWGYSEGNVRTDFAHWRIQVNNNEVLGFCVWDQNYGGELKGYERFEFRAKLRGRTLTGKSHVYAKKPFEMEGIVTEDFLEINCKSIPPSGGRALIWSLRRE